MAVPSVGANALRATGDARISGTLMVSGSVLQIRYSPRSSSSAGWALPELGMTGAALGNLLARFIICILTFYILTVPYTPNQF